MNALREITNFHQVSPTLATGGQPTTGQLHAAGRAGFQVVINLGLTDAPYALDDEKAAVNDAGMLYHHRPVDFQNPTTADFDHFRTLMRRHKDQKILVHCAANYRVSAFVGLYALAEMGWSESEVEHFIRQVWEPNGVWRAFLEKMKARIEAQSGG